MIKLIKKMAIKRELRAHYGAQVFKHQINEQAEEMLSWSEVERKFINALEKDDAEGVIECLKKGVDVNKEFSWLVFDPGYDIYATGSWERNRVTPLDIAQSPAIKKLLTAMGAKPESFFRAERCDAARREAEKKLLRECEEEQRKEEHNETLVGAFMASL